MRNRVLQDNHTCVTCKHTWMLEVKEELSRLASVRKLKATRVDLGSLSFFLSCSGLIACEVYTMNIIMVCPTAKLNPPKCNNFIQSAKISNDTVEGHVAWVTRLRWCRA